MWELRRRRRRWQEEEEEEEFLFPFHHPLLIHDSGVGQPCRTPPLRLRCPMRPHTPWKSMEIITIADVPEGVVVVEGTDLLPLHHHHHHHQPQASLRLRCLPSHNQRRRKEVSRRHGPPPFRPRRRLHPLHRMQWCWSMETSTTSFKRVHYCDLGRVVGLLLLLHVDDFPLRIVLGVRPRVEVRPCCPLLMFHSPNDSENVSYIILHFIVVYIRPLDW